VLDKYSQSGNGNGSITAYSIDSTTGRLTLVLNTQSVPPNSPAPTYWEVGQNPLQMKQAGSCLFTVNSADQSITPYSLGAGGQLVNVTTGKIATSATNISSINGNGSYVILTDSGNNTILPYSIASSCGLSLTLGGVTSNAPGTSNPTYSFISSNNKFLYILNQSTTSTGVTTAYSSITGFLIQPGQSLTQTVGSPYQTSASPVCMVGDPTNRYVYISSHDPGVVTGKLYDATTGTLAELPRGSSFTSAGLGTCLAISGAVD
jgi:6-phosphogluconolactonase (cycloisomerase 2 family)